MRIFRKKPSEKDMLAAQELVGKGVQEKDLRKAVDFFDKALKKNPRNVAALEWKAFSLLRLSLMEYSMRVSSPEALTSAKIGVRFKESSVLKSFSRSLDEIIKTSEMELAMDSDAEFPTVVSILVHAMRAFYLGSVMEYERAEDSLERGLDKKSVFMAPLRELLSAIYSQMHGKEPREVTLNITNILDRLSEYLKKLK